MSRPQWVAIAVIGPPAVVAAAVVSATLGPYGALIYGGLLLAGINTHHLFRAHHRPRALDSKGRRR